MHLLIVIIQLILSVSLHPKVITLSGAYCIKQEYTGGGGGVETGLYFFLVCPIRLPLFLLFLGVCNS
jgi:hypothetical protein